MKRSLEEIGSRDHDVKDMDRTSSVQRFVLLNQMAKQIRDPLKLRYHILNAFLPIRDTTFIALGNTIFHLARNPNVWTDLRTSALALGSQPLTFDLLKSLVSFRHVIYESLRLQGPSGRVFRTALRDTILPVGSGADGSSPVFVEQGVVAALNVWALHHDKDIWGDDAEEIRPQRCEDRKPSWDFVPFFGGPRVCPVQQQAPTQITYVLVRRVKAFSHIENRDPCQKYIELTKMAVESRNVVRVARIPTID